MGKMTYEELKALCERFSKKLKKTEQELKAMTDARDYLDRLNFRYSEELAAAREEMAQWRHKVGDWKLEERTARNRAELAAAREEVKHLELFHAAYAETASTEIQQAYQREDVALAKLSRYTELEKASADFVYEREYFIDVRKRMHRILDTLKKEDV